MIQLHNSLEEGVGRFSTFYKGEKIGEGSFMIINATLCLSWAPIHFPLSFGEIRELRRDFDNITPSLKKIGVKEIIAYDPLIEGSYKEFVTLLRFHNILGYTNTYMLFKKEV